MMQQYQVAEGIDAVIVDSVLGITNGLIQRQNKGERTPDPSPNPAPVGDHVADSTKGAIQVPTLDPAQKHTSSAKLNPPTFL